MDGEREGKRLRLHLFYLKRNKVGIEEQDVCVIRLNVRYTAFPVLDLA